MAEVKESIKEIAEADLVPETDYMLRVLKVRDAGQWEVARCGFVDPKDQDLVGRTVDFFIGKEGQWRGLSRLLKAAKLTEVPIDKDTGKQNTKTSLIGIEFPAAVSTREGKQGPENSVSPNIDYAWVETQMAESDGAGRSKKKKGGRQKSARSSETRTRRRRS